MTIKLDPQDVLVRARAYCARRQFDSFGEGIIHAFCEALAAATAEPEPRGPKHLPSSPPPAGNIFMRVNLEDYGKAYALREAERCGYALNDPLPGLRSTAHTCNLPVGHAGRHEWCGDRAIAEDRSDVDASPGVAVEELIRKAKAGEGRRTVAAVVHHYEALIGRALYYLADASTGDLHARTRAREALRGEL
jgi:hypothetical protein